MLRIDHLSKSYGSKNAVEDLSLHIRGGEIFGFIGPNGAGKTTTIKSCAGILIFDCGDITIDGVSLKCHPIQYKRKIAYIPDNPDLYEFYTGIKYLNFITDIYDVPTSEREEYIRKYSALFELTSDLGQLISTYSHGMKQKLALISALIHSPRLMMLDEPFAGLDPKAAYVLKRIMHDLCSKGGAIFFSMHVLDVAEKLCDKIAIIRKGKLVISGSMDEVKGADSLEEVFLELEDEHA